MSEEASEGFDSSTDTLPRVVVGGSHTDLDVSFEEWEAEYEKRARRLGPRLHRMWGRVESWWREQCLRIKRGIALRLYRGWPYDASIVVVESLEPGYYDEDYLLVHAVFAVFTHFVHTSHNMQWLLARRAAGEPLVEFSCSPSTPEGKQERKQHKDEMKLLALYDWWTLEYPMLEAECHKIEASLGAVMDGASPDHEEERRLMDELELKETALENVLTSKTVELVKLRGRLWS
jgi:hypothetical protein